MTGKRLERPSERRRSPRAREVGLRATVLARSNQSASFEVSDLSAGGARLVGELTLAVGEPIEVLISDQGSRPIALAARVLRIEPCGVGNLVVTAIAFTSVPDPIQDAIQGIVLRALERRRAGCATTVLVIDDLPDVGAALARDIRALGYGAVTARTPLDALYCIEDPNVGVTAAVVDLRLGTADGTDVLAYLADVYPSVRRVVMSGADVAAVEREVLSGRADTSLPKPWSREQLSRALNS